MKLPIMQFSSLSLLLFLLWVQISFWAP